MGQMDEARRQLKEWIAKAQPGDRVASVRALSVAAGGLSTAATVAVLREAIEDGWITSTRGPRGGYWRTEQSIATVLLGDALEQLSQQLTLTLRSIQAVQEVLPAAGRGV